MSLLLLHSCLSYTTKDSDHSIPFTLYPYQKNQYTNIFTDFSPLPFPIFSPFVPQVAPQDLKMQDTDIFGKDKEPGEWEFWTALPADPLSTSILTPACP